MLYLSIAEGRSGLMQMRLGLTRHRLSPPGVENPCLIAKVLLRGLNIDKFQDFQSVLTDFCYETGVETNGGLSDQRWV